MVPIQLEVLLNNESCWRGRVEGGGTRNWTTSRSAGDGFVGGLASPSLPLQESSASDPSNLQKQATISPPLAPPPLRRSASPSPSAAWRHCERAEAPAGGCGHPAFFSASPRRETRPWDGEGGEGRTKSRRGMGRERRGVRAKRGRGRYFGSRPRWRCREGGRAEHEGEGGRKEDDQPTARGSASVKRVGGWVQVADAVGVICEESQPSVPTLLRARSGRRSLLVLD